MSGLYESARTLDSTTTSLLNNYNSDDEVLFPTKSAAQIPGQGRFVNDIMMLLDTENVQQLRKEFSKIEEGLTMEEFVYVMKRFVLRAIATAEHSSGSSNSSSSTTTTTTSRKKVTTKYSNAVAQIIPEWMYDELQLVSAIVELFNQIDINGDGEMEWEEFTSFIVDSGLAENEHDPNAIQQYYPLPSTKWEDLSLHSMPIERSYYFSATDMIGVVEQQSSSLKLYSGRGCQYKTELNPGNGASVLAGHHMPALNQYVITSSNLGCSFYDDKSMRMLKSFHTPTSQHCLTSTEDTLYTSGVSGVIHAWDANKMEEKHHLGGAGRDGRLLPESHQDMVMDLLTIPTLESIASASMDHTIKLWDSKSSRLRRTLAGHNKGVVSLAYSTEYRFMVSVGFDYEGVVWNPYVKHMILKLHGHTSSLCGVEMIPNTPQIITGDISGMFKVWDIRTFTCMQTFMMSDEMNSSSSSSGASAMSTTNKNASSSSSSSSMSSSTKMSSFCAVNKHKSLVCGSRKLHMVEYEKLDHPELTDDTPVFAVYYNPTLLNFITASSDDVKIWDIEGKLLRRYRNISDCDLTSMCLDDRQRKFIVGDHKGRMYVFDYLSGALMKTFQYPNEEFISSRGKRNGGSRGSGNSGNRGGTNSNNNLRAHNDEIKTLFYVNDFKSIVSSSWDKSIGIHDERDADRGLLLRRIINADVAGDITCMTMSRNLSLILTGSSTSVVYLWDYEFLRIVSKCDGLSDGITTAIFMDPYPCFIAADQKGNLCLWGTRPDVSFNGVCLYKFKNLVDGSTTQSIPVTVMSLKINYRKTASKSTNIEDIETIWLFTGDEKGIIRIWDLTKVMQLLERKHRVVPLHTPMKCDNPRRGITYDASVEILDKEKKNNHEHPKGSATKRSHRYSKIEEEEEEEGDSTFLTTGGGGGRRGRKTTNNIADGPMPLVSPMEATVSLLKSWNAHTDAVLCLQTIQDPPSIITSGYDRLVKVWNYEYNNDCIGVLRRQNSAKSENSGKNKSGKNKGKNINSNNSNKHIGRRIKKEWTFRVDINKYMVKKRNEAQFIVQKINNVVELETKRRNNGDDESSPLYYHSDDDDNDVSEDEGKSGTDAASANNGTSNNLYGTRSGEEKLIGGMTQTEIDVMYDSVRTKVSNLTETRNRLINDFSNLTRSERSKRGNMSLASNLRRTPRMHPVGPQDAGKGLSATPRGRSSRIKINSKYGSNTGGISRRVTRK